MSDIPMAQPGQAPVGVRSLRVGLAPIANDSPTQQVVVQFDNPVEAIAVSIEEAPALVARLLDMGRPVTARSIADAWFVALANRAGYSNFVLGPG